MTQTKTYEQWVTLLKNYLLTTYYYHAGDSDYRHYYDKGMGVMEAAEAILGRD